MLLEHRVPKVQRDEQVLKDLKEIKVQLVLKVLLELKVHKVHKVLLVV